MHLYLNYPCLLFTLLKESFHFPAVSSLPMPSTRKHYPDTCDFRKRYFLLSYLIIAELSNHCEFSSSTISSRIRLSCAHSAVLSVLGFALKLTPCVYSRKQLSVMSAHNQRQQERRLGVEHPVSIPPIICLGGEVPQSLALCLLVQTWVTCP